MGVSIELPNTAHVPTSIMKFATTLCVTAVLLLVGCSPKPQVASSRDEGRAATPTPTPAPRVTAEEPPTIRQVTSDWSETVNFLSARWRVTYDEIAMDGRPTYFHYRDFVLEVKNVGGAPISFISQPCFADLVIKDRAGKVLVPPGRVGGNHISPLPQWAVIPAHAYLGLRVDTAIPVATGLHFESFVTTDHRLHATLVAVAQEGPDNQWTGTITLPPLTLRRGKD